MEQLSIHEALLMIVWGLGFFSVVVYLRRPKLISAVLLTIVGFAGGALVWIGFDLIVSGVSQRTPSLLEVLSAIILLGSFFSGILLLFRAKPVATHE